MNSFETQDAQGTAEERWDRSTEIVVMTPSGLAGMI
jgi:hypothetical protein